MPSFTKCLICGRQVFEKNFGAYACRCCASFFRRFIRSNPIHLKCVGGYSNCRISKEKSNNCRYCRLKKCISIGMKITKNVRQRSLTIDAFFSQPICSRIEFLVQSYEILVENIKRNYNPSIHRYPLTFSDMLKIKEDHRKSTYMWIEDCFPEFKQISKLENKSTIFANFYNYWFIIQSIITAKDKNVTFTLESIYGRVAESCTDFMNIEEADEKFVENLFQPSWIFFLTNMEKVGSLNLSKFELFGIMSLLLWDEPFLNENNLEIDSCKKMKNAIYKELLAYYENLKNEAEAVLKFDVISQVLCVFNRASTRFDDTLLLYNFCKFHSSV